MGWYRWGALAFMMGSALFLVNKFDEMSLHFLGQPMRDVISGDSTVLILFGQAVFALGFLAYCRFYAPRLGRAGRVALGMFAAGGVVLMLGHVTFLRALWRFGSLEAKVVQTGLDPFFIVIVGVLLLMVGLIGFGVACLRRPVMLRWRWLPLSTGIALLAFLLTSGEEITVQQLVLRTSFALGLFGLGLAMWLDRPGPVDRSAEALLGDQ